MSGLTQNPWIIPYAEPGDAVNEFPTLDKARSERISEALTNVRWMNPPRVVYQGTSTTNLTSTFQTYASVQVTGPTVLWVSSIAMFSGQGGVVVQVLVDGTENTYLSSHAFGSAWASFGVSDFIIIPESGSHTLAVQWRIDPNVGSNPFQRRLPTTKIIEV